MNNVTETNRHSRIFALALLIITIIIIPMALVIPIVSKGLEYNETKNDLAFRLKKIKKIVASKDQVFDGIETSRKQFGSQGYFSNQETESLASAELQQFLKKIISSAGGELTSTQVLPRKEEQFFYQIAVKVRMTGDMEMLRAVLYEIETSKPLILVEQLDIRPVLGKRNRLTRKIEPSGKMNINFQVANFMRKEG